MITRKLLTCLAPLLFLPAFAHAALPSSALSKTRIGAECARYATADEALECWLTKNPNVAASMSFSGPAGTTSWPAWPSNVKQDLLTDFDLMVAWFNAGMPATTMPHFFQNTNIAILPADPVYGPHMSESTGTAVYVSEVATSLAAELTSRFTWSVTNYTSAELFALFTMNERYLYEKPPTVSAAGYYWQGGNVVSPADPAYVSAFFKTNGLLATTAVQTIALLFQWERIFSHFYSVTGVTETPAQQFIDFWGGDAPPIPDYELIKGTTYTGPGGTAFGHFTYGCAGTMMFMKSMLRTVNIPEQEMWVSCGHATPIFPTAGAAMSHGDDPYDRLGYVSPNPGFPVPAPTEYLISLNTYNQMFPATQSAAACHAAVGSQMANIAIKYASDDLMNLYCQDLTSGATQANGAVYQYMQNYYPLQTLQIMGLWTNLANKTSALNWCATH